MNTFLLHRCHGHSTLTGAWAMALRRVLLPLALLWVGAVSAQAETRLPSFFSNGMVLQRQMPIRIWGQDLPGQAVTVSLGEVRAEAATDANGRWEARLPAQPAGGPHRMEIRGTKEIVLADVWIGEVWLCSGQSNMAFRLQNLQGDPRNIRTAALPGLRLFNVAQASVGEPAADVRGRWVNAEGGVGTWPALAFHFGQMLHEHLGVPVGLIHNAVGGTPVESWTASDVLDRIPELSGHVGWLRRQVESYPQARAEHEARLEAWRAGGAQGAEPQGRLYPPDSPWRPSGLYHGMIHPLIGYGIRGCIWYQGESNASRATVYGPTFRAMIADWRARWGQGDFPFLFVQLANFRARPEQPGPSAWAELREAQATALEEPNTGMAVALDIGDANDIHPPNKFDVGRRLLLQARAVAYGENIPASGPRLREAVMQGARIRLRFDHTHEGLRLNGEPPHGFAIAGDDLRFVWADATLDGNDVVVSSPAIPAPRYVRYAWADNPAANLFNGIGLPAAPFHTDPGPARPPAPGSTP